MTSAAQANTLTTNYSLNLPAVNSPTDQNLWGGLLNANTSALDGLLLTATNDIPVSLSSNTAIDVTYKNKVVLASASGGAFTVTLLPAATAGAGFRISVKKTDSSTNAVTIQGNASELIDLANTAQLLAQNDTITIISDGSQWWVNPFTVPVSVSNGTTSVAGVLKLATNAMTLAGSDTATALTPQDLASLVTAGATGTFTFGSVRVQWGSSTGNPSSPLTSTFGTAFSGTPYIVVGQTDYIGTIQSEISCPRPYWTSTTFSCFAGNGSGGNETFGYAAIGPK